MCPSVIFPVVDIRPPSLIMDITCPYKYANKYIHWTRGLNADSIVILTVRSTM
jgi:hypothetical protein